MLVLTRKVGDVVAIGDNIKVIVVAVNGKQVRLGIEADRSTTIHREEIYQKIKQESALKLNDMQIAVPDVPMVTMPKSEKKTVIIRKNLLKDIKSSADAN